MLLSAKNRLKDVRLHQEFIHFKNSITRKKQGQNGWCFRMSPLTLNQCNFGRSWTLRPVQKGQKLRSWTLFIYFLSLHISLIFFKFPCFYLRFFTFLRFLRLFLFLRTFLKICTFHWFHEYLPIFLYIYFKAYVFAFCMYGCRFSLHLIKVL